MNKQVLNVCITGAAGHVAYQLYSIILSGQIFGQNQRFNLKLLDIDSQIRQLEGITMELQDCASSLLNSIEYGSDSERLFKDMDIGIFLGGQTRKPGMEKIDLLKLNKKIFKEQGKILQKVAKPETKILVVAKPVCTNTLTLLQHCTIIPKKNVTCLTMLDYNRCISELQTRTGIHSNFIKDIIIWGNHSTTQYPDINFCTINNQKAIDIVLDEKEFIQKIQKRGSEITKLRNKTASLSVAVAIKKHLLNWINDNNENGIISMGIYTDGSFYGIPKDFVFSCPVKCRNFEFEVIKDLPINQSQKDKMIESLKELIDEKEQTNQISSDDEEK